MQIQVFNAFVEHLSRRDVVFSRLEGVHVSKIDYLHDFGLIKGHICSRMSRMMARIAQTSSG